MRSSGVIAFSTGLHLLISTTATRQQSRYCMLRPHTASILHASAVREKVNNTILKERVRDGEDESEGEGEGEGEGLTDRD